MAMELFNEVCISDNKTSRSYMINNALAYSKKAMNLQGFKCIDSTVTIYDKPEEYEEIHSFLELELLHKNAEIGMCIFHGEYQGSPVDITIDFETDILYIVSDSLEIIELVIKNLEKEDLLEEE